MNTNTRRAVEHYTEQAKLALFDELAVLVRRLTTDYQDLRKAFYQRPGLPGDGMCPLIACANLLLARIPNTPGQDVKVKEATSSGAPGGAVPLDAGLPVPGVPDLAQQLRYCLEHMPRIPALEIIAEDLSLDELDELTDMVRV